MEKIFKSKWENVSLCQCCGSINSYDGAYITCRECGANSHTFVARQRVFKKKKFLKFFTTREYIGYNLRLRNGDIRFVVLKEEKE